MTIALIISSLALVFVTLLLVFVTAGLVLITRQYVSHTQKMAEVMAKDYEVRVGPMINEDIKRLGHDKYNVSLINIGQNKAYVKNVRIIIELTSVGGVIEVFRNDNLIELNVQNSSKYVIDLNQHSNKITGTPFDVKFFYERAGLDYEFVKREIKIDLEMKLLT